MRYIQRDKDGNVTGLFANEQTYATELVADDHPDILAWVEARKPKPRIPGESLDEKIAALTVRLEMLEGKSDKLKE